MRFATLPLAAALAAIILTSCASQRIYFPDSAPDFGFRRAGEIKAMASVKPQASTSDSGQANYDNGGAFGFAGDLGYSFGPRWGAYAAYRGVNNVRRVGSFDFDATYRGRRAEVGAVYFAPIRQNGGFEALAGVGLGVLHRHGTNTLRDYDLHFRRYSLQATLSTSTRDEVFRGFGGLRMAMQEFYRFSSPDPDLRYNIGQPGQYSIGVRPMIYLPIEERPLGLLEPFAGFEVGYRWLRFAGQGGFSMRYFGPRTGDVQLYISAGIGFQWPGLAASSKIDRE